MAVGWRARRKESSAIILTGCRTQIGRPCIRSGGILSFCRFFKMA